MKIATTLFLFVVVGCTWRETIGTCVLESDFGFTINCAFKKSGLFRVRNLGGVKGYVGLGFSLGDELGFRDSISNVEASKRRSVQTNRGIPLANSNVIGNRNDVRQVSQNGRVVPPFKPLPLGASRPLAQQPERQRLVVQQNATANGMRTILTPSLATIQEDARQQHRIQQELKLRQQQRIQQELLAMRVLKQQRMQQHEAMRQQQMQKMTQQQVLSTQIKRMQQMSQNAPAIVVSGKMPNMVPGGMLLSPINTMAKPLPNVVANGNAMASSGLPPFVAMPKSSAQITDRISYNPTLLDDNGNEVPKEEFKQLPLPGDEATAAVNEMTLLSLQPIVAAKAMQSTSEPQNTGKRQLVSSSIPSSLPSLAPIHSMETSLKALAEASNITLEALEAAILLRQQQLMKKHQGPSTTTTTTTTMLPPVKKNNNFSGPTKVMNAPREYYPVGYDKNFDDNFASRVDLPDTSFYCGDQKHFPGLYADEDLGCMVFHVCALTDDGLIMKSFLCPESTLFDQTILKCNWWFYVDCKSSKSLYDSNIPISKSYQLMKALAFFSAYKNHDNSTHYSEESQENS